MRVGKGFRFTAVRLQSDDATVVQARVDPACGVERDVFRRETVAGTRIVGSQR